MSAAGGGRAGHNSAGAASTAAGVAGGASSRIGDAAGAATAPAVSVAEKEAERTVDVRAILKKKEDEVKEMLSPEKEMYGEWLVGMEDEVQSSSCLFLLLLVLLPLFCLSAGRGEKRFRCVPLLWTAGSAPGAAAYNGISS